MILKFIKKLEIEKMFKNKVETAFSVGLFVGFIFGIFGMFMMTITLALVLLI